VDGGNQVIPADELEPYLVSGPSKNGASYVVKLCADFLGGDGMYGLYRGLSWMTHPTAAVTDYYLEMRDGSDIPVLHTTAKTSDEGPLLGHVGPRPLLIPGLVSKGAKPHRHRAIVQQRPQTLTRRREGAAYQRISPRHPGRHVPGRASRTQAGADD